MFCLTHQERKALLFIGILIIVGSIWRFFNLGSKELIAKDSGYSSKSLVPLVININIASEEDLEKIPGIGGVIARRIIAYRTKYGFFTDLKDLKKVKGIGDKKSELIKAYISF